MADYYPLLARALDSIGDPTPEARQTVFERARVALVTQLRSLDPPLGEAEIERERASLDEAITRAEAAQAKREAGASRLRGDEAEVGRRPVVDRAPAIRKGGRRGRSLLTALALLAVIAPIAVAAWLYRDVPAGAPPGAPASPQPGPVASDPKFADRVSADGLGTVRPAPVPAVPIPASAPLVVAAQPAPVSQPGAGQPPLPPPSPVAPPTPPPAPIPAPSSLAVAPAAPAIAPPVAADSVRQPEIPIAQRALIAEANAADPQQPKITAGRAIWRTDVLSAGQGQLLETAVRAQVDVPDAGLSLLLTFRRNTDAALPASHTMELQFTTVGTGDSGRSIRDVGRPQMRVDEATAGTQIAGIPVPVKENYFLIGLSDLRSDIERNTELLLNRSWIELPIRFASGQRAALLFEKGVSGERIVANAFRQWSQPP